MAKNIAWLVVMAVLVYGCESMPKREKVLTKGSFQEKVAYVEEESSGKSEVAEFLGQPDKKRDFADSYAIWYYENTEEPLEVTFGADGGVLYVQRKTIK